MIRIIGMVMVMVVIRIYMIIMVQHQLKFLSFNIHLIHCYNKMVLHNKFISNTNNNVLTVKENIFKDLEIVFLQKSKKRLLNLLYECSTRVLQLDLIQYFMMTEIQWTL